MNRSEVEKKLRYFDKRIKCESDALNTNGVWLFLVVLGTWSVFQPVIRIAAIILTIFLFVGKLGAAFKYSAPLKVEFDAFQKTIQDSLNDEEAEECLEVYEKIKRKLRPKEMALRNLRFIFCWLFVVISLVYFLFCADYSLFDICDIISKFVFRAPIQ